MTEQVAQRAGAGEVAAEPPGQRTLGFAGVPGEEHRPYVGDPAEPAARDQFADVLDGGRVPVVVPDRGDHAGLRGSRGDVGGLAGVAADRLLDPEVLAGFGGRDGDLVVQADRRADRHDVDVRVGEHLPVVRGGPGIAEHVTGVPGPVGGGVGGVHQPGP